MFFCGKLFLAMSSLSSTKKSGDNSTVPKKLKIEIPNSRVFEWQRLTFLQQNLENKVRMSEGHFFSNLLSLSFLQRKL